MRPLSARERKLIAVALLIAALAIAWLGVVNPILSGFAARAERRELLLQRQAYAQRLIASIPRLRRQAERQRSSLRDFAIAAPDPARAGDMVAERLRTEIENAGGEFRASDRAAAPPGIVRVRADARLSLDQLVALLGRLQNDPPFLVVESLTIAADRALIENSLGELDVRLEVSIPFGASAT
jgi:general secretion pathway protein M